jgi:hypothetical protein
MAYHLQKIQLPQHFAWLATCLKGLGVSCSVRDYETVSGIPTGMAWEKMRPIVEGAREQYNFPAL